MIRDYLSYRGFGGGRDAATGTTETGEQDLFRSRLDQIIDMNHPLAKLARMVDWPFLEGRFGEVYMIPAKLLTGGRETGAAGEAARGGFVPVL